MYLDVYVIKYNAAVVAAVAVAATAAAQQYSFIYYYYYNTLLFLSFEFFSGAYTFFPFVCVCVHAFLFFSVRCRLLLARRSITEHRVYAYYYYYITASEQHGTHTHTPNAPFGIVYNMHYTKKARDDGMRAAGTEMKLNKRKPNGNKCIPCFYNIYLYFYTDIFFSSLFHLYKFREGEKRPLH